MPIRETQGTNVEPSIVDRAASVQRTGPTTTSFFGPGEPLPPQAPKDQEGRRFDYPVHYNLNSTPRAYEGVSFAMLRNTADSYDLLRLVLETRKDQIENFRWKLAVKNQTPEESEKNSEVLLVTEFLQSPDKDHSWNAWLRAMLEDMFVLDSICIFPRKTRGGGLYSLELVDPSTVKRLIDPFGRTPMPPVPAFQQQIKGMPAFNYTRDELLYFSRNFRTNRVYGFSPVEQVIQTVNIALRRQIHQLNYYTEGNVPEALVGVPDSWTLEQVKQFQEWWDSVMEGNTAARRHMRFLPTDPRTIAFTKSPDLKDMFDEWLARIICFAFSISPTMLVNETNRATADRTAETAKKEGLMPLLEWIKRLMDSIIQRTLGFPNLQFDWSFEDDLDPKTEAEVFQIYAGLKVYNINEIRIKLGEQPLDDAEIEKRTTSPLLPGREPGKPFGEGRQSSSSSAPPGESARASASQEQENSR